MYVIDFFLQSSTVKKVEPLYEKPIFVITQDENNHKIHYYKVDRKNNFEKTTPFISEPINVYTVYGCTESYIDHKQNKVLNKLDKEYCEIEKDGKAVEINSDFKGIINDMTELEHDIWDQKILEYKNDYYLVISLNVNLWTPYELYKYDKETKKLVKICTFDGEDVIGLKIKE